MGLFFQYFWFIAAAFMLANIVIWRQRSHAAIRDGVLSQEQFDRFIRWASIWLIGLPLVLGGIGAAAGWPSPFCAGMLSFADLPRTLASLAVLFAWASLLWWLWRGDGADFIARVLPSLSPNRAQPRTYSPRTVRLAITALIVISAVMTPIMWRTFPVPPEAACPAIAA